MPIPCQTVTDEHLGARPGSVTDDVGQTVRERSRPRYH